MPDSWNRLKSFLGANCSRAPLAQHQMEWLISCLQSNQSCEYGHRYQFANIDSIRSFQKQVPIVHYTDLQPAIERIAHGESDILFLGRPVAFEQTGGSSGGSKLIPYSEAALEGFRRAMLPWLGQLIDSHEISAGSLYLSLSPATRQPETTRSGISIGLPDGAYLGSVAAEALMELSAVPTWVGTITDVEQWQLTTLYWLLRDADLALISLWSPSFFLQLLQGLKKHSSRLQSLLKSGGSVSNQPLPADNSAFERLNHYLKSGDSRHLWPRLKLVSCWMEGASAPYAEQLRRQLPHAHFQGKGLLATEGVTTVPDRDGRLLLAASSGFYEFLQDNGVIRCSWELEEEREYEVVLTTAGGLYRYRTGDRVRYLGMVRGLPELRFLGRNDHSSDLVGEKLTEAFVSHCLNGVAGFRMLAAVNSSQPHYTLIIDSDCASEIATQLSVIEDRLKANPQYAYARKLGQLGPLTTTQHQDPLQIYMAEASRQQCLGDVKVGALLPQMVELAAFMESIK